MFFFTHPIHHTRSARHLSGAGVLMRSRNMLVATLCARTTLTLYPDDRDQGEAPRFMLAIWLVVILCGAYSRHVSFYYESIVEAYSYYVPSYWSVESRSCKAEWFSAASKYTTLAHYGTVGVVDCMHGRLFTSCWCWTETGAAVWPQC